MGPSEDTPYQVWDGHFATFDEAQRSLENHELRTSLFGLPAWLSRQNLLLADSRRSLTEVSVSGISRPTLLPLLIARGGPAARRVVDFGGGSGWVFATCERAQIPIESYIVIELPEVVTAFAEQADNRISFCDPSAFLSMDCDLTDVMYTNSCLQYQRDNSLFLSLVNTCRSSFILIDELLWSRKDCDWFTIQQNSDSRIVSRFISVKNLIQELDGIGYTLVWRNSSAGTEARGFPNMNTFDEQLRIHSRLSLLLKKKY
jgi:putative methyltransferase (TIGR04325 family)